MQDKKWKMDNFEEYLRQGEPNKAEKAKVWKTAIGLQQVDGLKPSDYLISTAKQNIEGEITIEEVQQLIKSYYQSKTIRTNDLNDTEEADKVSANIAKLLSERSFAFTVAGFTAVHRRIFDGVFKFAGKIRDYNITKKEWVLLGDTVLYVSAPDLPKAIEYDIEQEKQFNYTGLNMEQILNHITKFVSGLWQIHPFGEGNTRTVAVFTIQYLRSMGFEVENDLFADHSWYFRNALVRANYQNIQNGVTRNPEYLERFFRNLLLGEKNELRNRDMIVQFTDTVNDTVKSKNDTVNDTVFSLIKQNNKITATQISESLNISLSTAKRRIKELREQKIIERIGSDKTGYWKINDK